MFETLQLVFITNSMTIFFPDALEDSATDARINLGKSLGPSTEPTIGVHTKWAPDLEADMNTLCFDLVELWFCISKKMWTVVLLKIWHGKMNVSVPEPLNHSALELTLEVLQAGLLMVIGKNNESGFWAPCSLDANPANRATGHPSPVPC